MPKVFTADKDKLNATALAIKDGKFFFRRQENELMKRKMYDEKNCCSRQHYHD